MRLFLASSRLTSTTPALSELVGPGARAVVVANALDNLPGFPRENWVAEERRVLESGGFSTRELDLRCYYADSSALASNLSQGTWSGPPAAMRSCSEKRCIAVGSTRS
jgi:hypothetical protein